MGKKKFTTEEKVQAVELHIRDGMGYGGISDRYGVPISTLRQWIRQYQTFGVEGLRDRERNQSYSGELKRFAVEEYQSGKCSLHDICVKYKIHSDKQLRNWIKVYNGHRELRPSRGRGSDIYMAKGRNTTYEERVEIVSYCIEHGNNYTAAIEKYGVSYQQIYSWVRKYESSGVNGLVDRRGRAKAEDELTEVERLQQENRILQAKLKDKEMEIALLKKLRELRGGGWSAE